MATVYFSTIAGSAGARPIYGVKNSDGPVATLPPGVVDCDIANPPAGCERTHVVDDTAIPPVLVPNPNADEAATVAAAAALGLRHLKALALAASNQTIAGIAWSANGYTPLQMQTRAIAAYKALP